MKTLIVVVALSASMIVPAFSMHIKDYPRTAAEVEYCYKAQMNKDIEVPYGCMTLGQRIYDKMMKK